MGSSCLYQDLPHGITLIDTGYHRPRFDASYLVVAGGEAALVAVGTSHSVPRLLQVLADKRIAREQVRYVMITHVSLDHPPHLAARLHVLIDEYAALARALKDTGETRHTLLVEGLRELLWRMLQAHGCTLPRERALELLAVDIELNAQGLAVWLDV